MGKRRRRQATGAPTGGGGNGGSKNADRNRSASGGGGHTTTDAKELAALYLQVMCMTLGVVQVEIPGPKGKPERASMVDLVGGDSSTLRMWRDLTKHQKLQQLSVDATDVMALLQNPDIATLPEPSDDMIAMVQAQFMLAVEQSALAMDYEDSPDPAAPKPPLVVIDLDGNRMAAPFEIPDELMLPTALATMAVLRINLEVTGARQEAYYKMKLVMLYMCWYHAPTWYIGGLLCLLICSFIVFPPTNMTRISEMLEYMCDIFFRGKSAQIEWKSDAFITTLLLLTLVGQSSYMVLVGGVAVLPYLFGFVESKVGNYADKGSLSAVRHMASLLNKGVLLVVSLTTWTSMVLVSMLYFRMLGLYGVTLVVYGLSMILTLLNKALSLVLSPKAYAAFESENNRPLLCMLVVVMELAVWWWLQPTQDNGDEDGFDDDDETGVIMRSIYFVMKLLAVGLAVSLSPLRWQNAGAELVIMAPNALLTCSQFLVLRLFAAIGMPLLLQGEQHEINNSNGGSTEGGDDGGAGGSWREGQQGQGTGGRGEGTNANDNSGWNSYKKEDKTGDSKAFFEQVRRKQEERRRQDAEDMF